jgi:hypothetical protein
MPSDQIGECIYSPSSVGNSLLAKELSLKAVISYRTGVRSDKRVHKRFFGWASR